MRVGTFDLAREAAAGIVARQHGQTTPFSLMPAKSYVTKFELNDVGRTLVSPASNAHA